MSLRQCDCRGLGRCTIDFLPGLVGAATWRTEADNKVFFCAAFNSVSAALATTGIERAGTAGRGLRAWCRLSIRSVSRR
jgi:hypothetical protein